VCDLETSRIGAPYIYNVRLLRVKDAVPTCFGTSVPSSESTMCQYPADCNTRHITNRETRSTLDLDTHYRPEHVVSQTRSFHYQP